MSTTQHPLTEAAAVEMWDASPCPEGYEFRGMLTVEQDATLYAMRAAFDAGREHERTNPEDDRPWEPLDGRTPRVGDEVRQDWSGVTRTGVVGHLDEDGDPCATEGGFIGELCLGTWYVRRPAQELPTADGAVIVPADGREYIEATICGETHYARAALRSWVGDWYAAWRAGERKCGLAASEEITPGTWKVGDQ